MPPGLAGAGRVRLQKRPDVGGGNHGLLRFRDASQGVFQPVAPVPERLGDGCFESFMGVGEDNLHVAESTTEKDVEEQTRKVRIRWGRCCRHTISRWPSAFAATTIMAATLTTRPPKPVHWSCTAPGRANSNCLGAALGCAVRRSQHHGYDPDNRCGR